MYFLLSADLKRYSGASMSGVASLQFEYSLRTLTAILEEVHAILQKVIQAWEARVSSYHQTDANQSKAPGQGMEEQSSASTEAGAGASFSFRGIDSFPSFLGNAMHKVLATLLGQSSAAENGCAFCVDISQRIKK
jgi:hypothetical protein